MGVDITCPLAGKRRIREADDQETAWDCCNMAISLPPLNTMLDSSPEENADDSFSYISDLLHHQEFYIPDYCDFSQSNFNVHDESTPVSPQNDLNEFLMSLLTQSEAQKKFSIPENESLAAPEITEGSSLNVLKGEGSASLYSGPTLSDVQSALSIYHRAEEQYDIAPTSMATATASLSNSPTMFDSFHSAMLRSQYGVPNSEVKMNHDTFYQRSYRSFSSSINELFYRRLHRAKSDAKYSLKVKCPGRNGNGIDDGYKWRKYGQKAIKNSPYPRSYYRCTNPRCSAKKQVERCVEEPETVAITYEGLHLHYSYSQLQITQQPNYSLRHPDNNIYENENVIDNIGYINACFDKGGADVMQSSESPTMVAVDQHHLQQQPKDKWYEPNFKFGGDGDGDGDGMNVGVVDGGRRDGLLQDILPFGIINPLSSSSSSSSTSSSSP